MIIDAHQHFWDLNQPFDYQWLKQPELNAIDRDFLPAHLAEEIRKAGVDKTVFVQTQHNLDENRWILKLAEQNEFIAGVVGWIDLASADCERQLDEFLSNPKFVGVRHITQDEPDDDFIVQQNVIRGLKVLEKHQVPFDLLFFVKHLKHATSLADQLPDLPMVIDHLAKPRIKEQSFDVWERQFREASKRPNLWCKLSGMITEADWQSWKPADLRPYVQIALEAFGPSRCMFGSDWPVCELAGSYQQVFDALVAALGPISDDEHQAIFGDNARQFYQLEI